VQWSEIMFEKYYIERVVDKMANEFKVCDECQAVNLKTLIPKLKEIDPDKSYLYLGDSFCFAFLYVEKLDQYKYKNNVKGN